jgi:hypothetical protein
VSDEQMDQDTAEAMASIAAKDLPLWKVLFHLSSRIGKTESQQSARHQENQRQLKSLGTRINLLFFILALITLSGNPVIWAWLAPILHPGGAH